MSEVEHPRETTGVSRETTAAELLPLVYDELRKLAAARLAHEAAGQTLQATALVHEAWLRLLRAEQTSWQNRGHFFAAASEAMRRILIESARRKQAAKRGARLEHVDIDQLDLAAETDPESLLRVSSALDQLALEDPQAAELVKLRFFIGVGYREAAETLGISERSAKRLWDFGRSWLYRELTRAD